MTPAAAQDEPCVPQVVAVEAATAKVEAIDATFATVIQQVQPLVGPLSVEAPELLPVYTNVLTELAQIAVPDFMNTGDAPGAAERWVNGASNAELAQLNAGLVAPNGTPRPSVAILSALVTQAQIQAATVAAANRELADAIQQLTDCAQAAASGQ